jgi:hypothetical protein
VPVTLVFGIIPRIGTKLPKQPERVQAMISARKEMREIVAKLKISRSLRRAVPPAADNVFSPGDLVLVFQENPEGFRVLSPSRMLFQKQCLSETTKAKSSLLPAPKSNPSNRSMTLEQKHLRLSLEFVQASLPKSIERSSQRSQQLVIPGPTIQE